MKSEGNIAFVEKKYEKAIEIYTEAIALCNTNHVRVCVWRDLEFLFAAKFRGVPLLDSRRSPFSCTFVTVGFCI